MTEPKDLFSAMALAFPKIEGALKESANDAFKREGKATKYADLSSVVNAIKPALAENGLFFVQLNHEQQGGVCVETIVCHSSGGQMSFGKLFVPAGKQDAQGYGSALTYARRYSLMTAFGVCPEDDDGNAAVKAPSNDRAPAQQSQAISKAELAELLALVNDTNTSAESLCEYYKIASLPELPAARFAHAKGVLVKRLPEKEAA